MPAIPGIEETPYLTPETVCDLASLPKHLIVVGANSVGLELAQAFHRLGAEVTVLDEAQPLAADDPECAQIVLDALMREGVAIHSGVPIAALAKSRNKVIVTLEGVDGAAGETVEGSHLLIASGRRPALDDLGLDAAGIKVGANGIVVDGSMLTGNKRVYAIGDVVGGQSVDVAHAQADIVVRNALLRQSARMNSEAVPSVTFTDPELAHVGLTEAQGRARHKRVRILRWPYHENDRAQAERMTRGHIKIVATEAGTILGVSIVGAGAGDMIGLWALALARHLDLRAMADFILPYPTLGEIGQRAAMNHAASRLTAPFVRRIMGIFRRSR